MTIKRGRKTVIKRRGSFRQLTKKREENLILSPEGEEGFVNWIKDQKEGGKPYFITRRRGSFRKLDQGPFHIIQQVSN